MTRSVDRWTGEVLMAHSVEVGVCSDGESIGISFISVDGSTFAHAHFESIVAEELTANLMVAISESMAPPPERNKGGH